MGLSKQNIGNRWFVLSRICLGFLGENEVLLTLVTDLGRKL